jgi:putative colanic acid biosynthesis UDP-glucose lipid carrier transferase
MIRKKQDYGALRGLLAEPQLWDPANMPVGRDYLRSPQKAALDALLGLGVLPITAIPTAAGALAVKYIDHERPVFKQRRIGVDGEPFTIFKLTTMPGASEDTHSNGRHDDPCRSPLGQVLSLLRIDESLQLANVAKREMSIIGPRPLLGLYLEKVHHLIGAKEADEWIKVRSLALPGIFDEFSNLHHGYELEGDPDDLLRQRIELESTYILEKASVGEDLRVLGNTLQLFASTTSSHAGRIAMQLAHKVTGERFGQ